MELWSNGGVGAREYMLVWFETLPKSVVYYTLHRPMACSQAECAREYGGGFGFRTVAANLRDGCAGASGRHSQELKEVVGWIAGVGGELKRV